MGSDLNPWVELPARPPYVLSKDAPLLRSQTGVHLNVLPCPYLGSPKEASVYALNLNPAFTEASASYADPHYLDEVRRGLTFSSTYPFWALDPSLVGSPGHAWWATLLGELRARIPIEVLGRRLMCLQWFPYHSAGAADIARIPLLPSQHYTFDLLRRAIRDARLIVVMRSEQEWLASVPELRQTHYIQLRNVRRPFFRRGNMPPGAFERLVETLADLAG
jgi:hypothetical protein